MSIDRSLITAVLSVMIVGAYVWLTVMSEPIPEMLIALVGAVVGLYMPTPTKVDPPTPPREID